MPERFDADNVTVPDVSNGGDVSQQQREIVSRRIHACSSNVGTSPRKA